MDNGSAFVDASGNTGRREFYTIAGKRGSVVRSTSDLDSPVVGKLERGDQIVVVEERFVEDKRRLFLESPLEGWITHTPIVVRNFVIPTQDLQSRLKRRREEVALIREFKRCTSLQTLHVDEAADPRDETPDPQMRRSLSAGHL